MNSTNPPSSPTIQANTLVDERYRLKERLGEGGFGQVWRAFDEMGKRTVAIKLFTVNPGQNPLWFWNELSILRSHRVPGIVELLDEGFWEGIPYLVMELVHGKPFPGTESDQVDEILERAARLLDVLSLVHAEGILHHDIKPSNVLVNDAGDPILLDFGISADVNVDLLSSQKYVYGCVEYVAPERLRGEAPSQQSDLYSVGVMLYEALTGRLPFANRNTKKLIQACIHKAAPRLNTKVPSLPSRIARLIDALLFKNPGQRPNSAAEVADMLRNTKVSSPDIPEWLASHHIDLNSKDNISAQRFTPLFAGMERLFHEPSRAADELYARTQGNPAQIENEVGIWLRRGARFEGNLLRVGRRALQPIPAPKTAEIRKASFQERLEEAYRLIHQGPLDHAMQVLMEAIKDLRGQKAPSSEETLIYEQLLSAWTDIALADTTKRVFGPLQFELHRAPPTPLILHIDQMTNAAAAIAAGGPKALDLLNDLPPFEDIRLETRRQGLRSVACRRCSPEVIKETYDSIDQWIEAHKNENIALARYYFWRGWYCYQRSQFSEAAEMHLSASRLEPWPIGRASALTAAASALMETMQPQHIAVSIAEQALAQVKVCESPFMEARAEWVLRAARYRNFEDLDDDKELLSAVQRVVGAPDVEAQVCLTEAAFAFRKGNSPRAAELAQRAADLWRARMMHSYYGLAQAFAWAMGGAPSQAEELASIHQIAKECRFPGIGLQTLAFLRNAAPAEEVDAQDLMARVQDEIPEAHWDRRMDILSVNEARARLGLAVCQSQPD